MVQVVVLSSELKVISKARFSSKSIEVINFPSSPNGPVIVGAMKSSCKFLTLTVTSLVEEFLEGSVLTILTT